VKGSNIWILPERTWAGSSSPAPVQLTAGALNFLGPVPGIRCFVVLEVKGIDAGLCLQPGTSETAVDGPALVAQGEVGIKTFSNEAWKVRDCFQS
jgi:hypothetical protein